MKFYLKLLFFAFLAQNALCEDLTVESALNATAPTSTLVTAFLNDTLLSGNNDTSVIYNCTGGATNLTDPTQCTPIKITLSEKCTPVNYDFLIFAISWQPRLCTVNSKHCHQHADEEPKWRIDGLRGSFTNGTRPVQCCSDKQLKISELSPLMSDLKEKWAYEKNSTVEESIVEDWNLHGSCVKEAEQKTSVQLYRKSLDLASRLPIQEWLSNAKIVPSNDKKYGLQFVNYTILSKLNKRFQMRCKTFNYEKQISIIDTINVCVDRHTSDIIDCPQDFESNCLDLIYYTKNLLEYEIPEEIYYRDMNYYRYRNYNTALTGVGVGALGATAALGLPAAYYYFKTQNKLKKYKYNNGYGGGYPGGFAGGSHFGGGGMPWYASTAFANSFAAPPAYNAYNSPRSFGNLGTANNLYPRQSYGVPPTVFSGVQGNKNFGNLNVPDLSPNFYNSRSPGSNYPSYPAYPSSYPNYPPPKYSSYPSSNYPSSNPSYPSYPSSNPSYPNYPPPKYSSFPSSSAGGINAPNYPSYPSYPNSGSNPSYPAYPGQAPPPYSKYDNKNSPYPKQDNPPPYSSIDKNKPSYPAYPNSGASGKDAYKPSAPAFSDISSGDKQKSGGLYPKVPSDSGSSGKYSPSAPSFGEVNSNSKPSYPSSGDKNKPSYPAYPSSKPSSPSSGSSKPKSSGGIFSGIWSKMTGSGSKPKSSGSGSSFGRGGGGRSGGSRGGGGIGRSRDR